MDQDGIKRAISSAVVYLTEHPDEAAYTDSAATARLERGLRCRIEAPGGESVFTDMPASVGGEGSAPSTGWLFRAALAGCVATLVAMEAAREDIPLDDVEVTVDSESDDRGILGISQEIAAGPLSIRVAIRVTSAGAPAESLERIARTAGGAPVPGSRFERLTEARTSTARVPPGRAGTWSGIAGESTRPM